MAPQTFGSRFLSEFRRLGGSTKTWPERTITLLDQAERAQFIDALTKASSRTARQLVITAHTAEPETLAKRALELKSVDANAEMMTFLALLAGIN
jgi:hypothetical protein